jgi:hypothetical protein
VRILSGNTVVEMVTIVVQTVHIRVKSTVAGFYVMVVIGCTRDPLEHISMHISECSK